MLQTDVCPKVPGRFSISWNEDQQHDWQLEIMCVISRGMASLVIVFEWSKDSRKNKGHVSSQLQLCITIPKLHVLIK